jgi:hypothetical protein
MAYKHTCGGVEDSDWEVTGDQREDVLWKL